MSRYESMIGHLLAQYRDCPNLFAFIYAVSEELELVNKTLDDLKYKRWIDSGEGVQLDGIGDIVDQDRIISQAIALEFFGFEGQPNVTGFNQARFRRAGESYLTSATLSDPEYRLVLRAKIVKNNSLAYAEDTIQSLAFVFNVNKVVLHDIGNAKFIVAIGRKLSKNEIIMARALDLFVRGGGIGYKYMIDYDATNYFGFYHQKGAKGFGQGKFASIFM